MSHRALLKIGPLVTVDRWDEVERGKARADRFYQRGALKLLRREGVPLVVDHEMNRRIGVVDGLVEFDDTDGPWVWARAEVSDPPSWLRTGTCCSVSFIPIHWSALGWMHSALVDEVSVLSASKTPVEPLARVAWIREEHSSSPATAASSDHAVAGEVIIHNPPVLIRRYYPAKFTVR